MPSRSNHPRVRGRFDGDARARRVTFETGRYTREDKGASTSAISLSLSPRFFFHEPNVGAERREEQQRQNSVPHIIKIEILTKGNSVYILLYRAHIYLSLSLSALPVDEVEHSPRGRLTDQWEY